MMKNSKVLALKYRPVVFEDLIGQKIITDTIVNSIKEKKIPNAYLFTGIRGVGKTTFARLIAKGLNCLNGIENLCNESLCENCKSISNSNHIDILEMDAASKTGVDDVRELIEFSRYGPSIAKYKIYIIDEVHMLSKQAFNALLKTLEEPPQYENGGGLKFIFATTEIKKIPITVVSRCQRFDLPRVKSDELFSYIKEIKDKENGNISDDALKLIVKISEGSVRDALSLLDRAILSTEKNKEMDLKGAQKIFGYFDKSQLIDLFSFLFEGDEEKVLDIYRNIYYQGIEPKIFLNDFLEILYYFKNIDFLKIESTNFSLNDEQFDKIKNLVKNVDNQTLILFWQFTINTLDEMNIVTNQSLSIEMFLIRIMHLKSISNSSKIKSDNNVNISKTNPSDEKLNKNSSNYLNLNNKTIEQIKNIVQEKNIKQNIEIEDSKKEQFSIKSLDELIELCNTKKEIKLKYELERNVNLVSFENGRIEISFNEDLDKEFIKNLSNRLFEWTNKRWIITLSKKTGNISKKDFIKKNKKKDLEDAKNTNVYKKIVEVFSDAELINVEKEE